MKEKEKKRTGGRQMRFVWIYLIPIVLVMILQLTGATSAPENALADALYQSAGLVPPDISIIGIDEQTLDTYGAFEEWSREKIAAMINKLNADEKNAPAVIAVDIGFFGETDPEKDAALAEAVRRAGNVVLVSTVTFGEEIREYDDGSFELVTGPVLYETPYPALYEAAAAVGHSNVALDDDGVARHAYGSIKYRQADGQTVTIPSFAWQIYSLWAGREAPDSFGAGEAPFYIAYSGEPRDFYGSVSAGYSFCRMLDGDYAPAQFRGGIVLIGAYASGTQDNYYSSINKKEQMYGVEIHANVVNQLRENVYKRELSPWGHALITLLFGLLTAALVTAAEPKISIPAGLGLCVLYLAAAKPVYDGPGILLPLLSPVIASVVICVLHIGVRYFTVYREKKRIIASYGKYLSPEIAATIAETGEEALKLGGTKKDIAVLFVDIRSFTTLSESLPPEKVVEMLNSYLSITTSAIFKNKGTVDKFIGDATMGVFNAPLDLDDYTYRAVCAGLDMAEQARTIDDRLAPELRGRVGFGVGINCGDAVVGNIGTSFRMEYTAIGDTVNTASRLEGQAKAGNVIISDAVYQRVRDRIRCEDMGKVTLKGKAEPVQIYRAVEVTDRPPVGT